MPLESNPDVINEFIQKLGFDIQKYAFNDLYDLEEQSLKQNSSKTLAALLTFPVDEKVNQFNENEKKEIIKKGQFINPKLYFMKQYAENACGTIAIFNTVMNLIQDDHSFIQKDSLFDKFYKETIGLNPDERGHHFKQLKELKQQHVEAVQNGETQYDYNDDVFHHFVCLVSKNGILYELDGMKEFPINHGNTSKDSFLVDVARVFNEFVQRSDEQMSYNVLVLQKND
ncbi:hypothetical protein IMG5_076630 [Ichthyophthirius multifiliis]|uniref:Ubiquitin carboxyl-terminal hydrolase n=1 Tax=Ichthyophthirius multifiliis TaxID=5932 RepID=G0QQ73_ICHMU|nr:hypothetical protein IMG5_076630 [Ichthyophthirius multifiliis]EGR32633.1 hypothetical protein IMG5_076630 [Ichthyophthirius multifiliis]|eukprot:XP_004036619.1 hypothetical protein IMG5_076630 [Ichthyophthirius multifiliis]